MDFPELLKKGVAVHTSGQLDYAEVVYREIPEYKAHDLRAHYNIGPIDVSRGQYDNTVKHSKVALDNEKSSHECE